MCNQYFDSTERVDEYLKTYQADNVLSDEEMESRLAPDQLNRILPSFLLNDAINYDRYVNMVVETLSRTFSDRVTLKNMTQTQAYDFENLACQELKGAHHLFFGISGKDSSMLLIAGKFARKEFKEMNALAYDSVCELINTINGAFASDMSHEGIILEVMPPCTCSENTLRTSGPHMYYLSADVYDAEIDLIFSFESEMTIECSECSENTDAETAKILIVDDSATLRGSMREILEGAGHNVVGEAVNGLDAIEKYMHLRPDITTMDITMPEMDGITALKKIIALDPDAKIVMVSSTAQKSTVSEALIHGASGFFRKPLDPEEVTGTISELVTYSF